MDTHARSVRGVRQAACVVQGMDAEADIAPDATMELGRPQAALLQLIDGQKLKLLAEDASHEIAFLLKLAPAARQMGERNLAAVVDPGIDAMCGAEFAHQSDRVLHRLVELARILEAVGLDEGSVAALVAADAGKA